MLCCAAELVQKKEEIGVSKTQVYIGTIKAERATNEWQREYALPVGFKEKYTEEEQRALRKICELSDQECEEMRTVYKTFPPKLTLCDSTSSQGDCLILGWPKEADEQAKEALWLLEQMGGDYMGNREEFDEAWEKGEYDPGGPMIISKELIEIEGGEREKHD